MSEPLDPSADTFNPTPNLDHATSILSVVRERLLGKRLLGCQFSAAPNVSACTDTYGGVEAVGLNGGGSCHFDSDLNSWLLMFPCSGQRFPDLSVVHMEGDEETMWRDLAVLIDSDFAISRAAPEPVDAGVDLSGVRERLNRLYHSDLDRFHCNAGFRGAPHVRPVEFGNILGLLAHGDNYNSDWWQVAFRTDGVPWYDAQDWRVSGNVARMQHDLVAILMGDFTLVADPLWEKRPWKR